MWCVLTRKLPKVTTSKTSFNTQKETENPFIRSGNITFLKNIVCCDFN